MQSCGCRARWISLGLLRADLVTRLLKPRTTTCIARSRLHHALNVSVRPMRQRGGSRRGRTGRRTRTRRPREQEQFDQRHSPSEAVDGLDRPRGGDATVSTTSSQLRERTFEALPGRLEQSRNQVRARRRSPRHGAADLPADRLEVDVPLEDPVVEAGRGRGGRTPVRPVSSAGYLASRGLGDARDGPRRLVVMGALRHRPRTGPKSSASITTSCLAPSVSDSAAVPGSPMAKSPTPSACVRASASQSRRGRRDVKADGGQTWENHQAPARARAVPRSPPWPVNQSRAIRGQFPRTARSAKDRRSGLARLQHRLDSLDHHRPNPGLDKQEFAFRRSSPAACDGGPILDCRDGSIPSPPNHTEKSAGWSAVPRDLQDEYASDPNAQ